MNVVLTVSFKTDNFLTFIFVVLLEYHLDSSVNPSQTLARGPSPSAEEYQAPFCSDLYLRDV